MADVLAYPSDIAPPGWSPDRDPDDPFAGGYQPKPGPKPDIPTTGSGVKPAPITRDDEETARFADVEQQVFANLPDEPPEPEVPRPAVQSIGTAGLTRYTLLYPVKIEGLALREIKISPPALWDVQDFLAGKIKSNFELISRMTGLSPVMLGALRWPDVQALLNITTDLLPAFVRDAIDQQGRGNE